MELRHIKELMGAMRRHKMKRLVFEKDGVKLELEQEETEGEIAQRLASEFSAQQLALPPPSTSFTQHRAVDPVASAAASADTSALMKAEEAAPEENVTHVTSPIVGTYYSASSPESPSFIQVGDRVEKDTVVCIIEAMKVMNEVKAGVSGTVKECLIENGHPVEFGTKLFSITP